MCVAQVAHDAQRIHAGQHQIDKRYVGLMAGDGQCGVYAVGGGVDRGAGDKAQVMAQLSQLMRVVVAQQQCELRLYHSVRPPGGTARVLRSGGAGRGCVCYERWVPVSRAGHIHGSQALLDIIVRVVIMRAGRAVAAYAHCAMLSSRAVAANLRGLSMSGGSSNCGICAQCHARRPRALETSKRLSARQALCGLKRIGGIQHPVYIYAVALGRIVYEDVRDRAYQHTVLH